MCYIIIKPHPTPCYACCLSSSLDGLDNIYMYNITYHQGIILCCMLQPSPAMSMVEVRVVNLDCHGCASKLRRALFKLKGVEEIEIEMEMQKIVVKGYGLEERKVLKAIKRAGKKAEPWPYPGHSSHFACFYKYPTHIANQYYYDRTQAQSAGHNLHTFFHTPSVYSVAMASDEAVASLFSDDNPHACAVM